MPINIKNSDVKIKLISTDGAHHPAIPIGKHRAIDMAGSHP